MIAVNQSNDCGIPCKTLGLSLGTISYSMHHEDIAKLKIEFPTRLLITEEKLLFTPNLGGSNPIK